MDERVLRELGDELMRLARRRAHVYPGSRLDSARPWILASNGLWRAPKPEVAP